MRNSSGRVFGLALVLLGLLGACSDKSASPGDAGAGDAGADLVVTEETCQGIRSCLWGCSTGMEACVQACIDKGSTAAKALYQALAACTAPHCPLGDFTCSCDQQCYAEGNCLAETEACVAGAAADLICDELCH